METQPVEAIVIGAAMAGATAAAHLSATRRVALPEAPLDARPEELDVAIAIDRMRQALDIPVARIEHRQAGLRSVTPGRGLAIGEAGFFWMVGPGGYGIQTAPAAGWLPASLVNGSTLDSDLQAAVPLCDPRRFERAVS